MHKYPQLIHNLPHKTTVYPQVFQKRVYLQNSSNNFCRISDFEHLTACFGGDTDGDGNISVADAVLIARNAIGVNSLSCDFNMADIDADGNISISDAISVMRFAMQVR